MNDTINNMIADAKGQFIKSADFSVGNFACHLLLDNRMGYLRMYGITIVKSDAFKRAEHINS